MIDCSIKNLDLSRVPFSRAKSRFMVFYDLNTSDTDSMQCDEKPHLYISLTCDSPAQPCRRGLMRLAPVKNGEELTYSYKANLSKLEIITETGSISICISGSATLRIRGDIALRISALLPECESEVSEASGAHAISFESVGKVLFAPVEGSADYVSEPVQSGASTDTVTVTLTPADSGFFDIALHDEAALSGNRDAGDVPFEDAVASAEADFASWLENCTATAPEFESLRTLAAYVTWISVQAPLHKQPHSVMKNDLMYSYRNGQSDASSFGQALIAQSMINSPEVSLEFLSNMFKYQTENGQIPFAVNKSYADYSLTPPPLHGMPALNLMGVGADITSLYEPLRDYANWWKSYRASSRLSRLPYYSYSDECLFSSSSIFKDGVPVVSPDLATHLILIHYSLNKMAVRLELFDEAIEWERYGDSMKNAMLRELWNGEQFLCRNAITGEPVDTDSPLLYFPIILGELLPYYVIAFMSEKLEHYYMTYAGIKEGLKSKIVNIPYQALFAQAFYRSGKRHISQAIARGVMRHVSEHGFVPICHLDDEIPHEDAAVPPCTRWPSEVCAAVLHLCDFL